MFYCIERAHSDVLLNNMCEVFNRQLIDGRDKLIVTKLDFIREYLMKRIVNVQMVIQKTVGPLTLTATKLFKAIKDEAVEYISTCNGVTNMRLVDLGEINLLLMLHPKYARVEYGSLQVSRVSMQ